MKTERLDAFNFFCRWICAGLWIGFLLPGSLSYAQTYRDLGIPPSEIYQKMVVYAQEKEFEKLNKTLQLIKPVTQALGTKFSTDFDAEIQKAIIQKEGDKVLRAVQRLVSFDMKDLLDIGVGAMRESSEKATTKFKTAYLDYLLLSPYVQVKSFSADQNIKNAFRKAVTTFSSEEDLKQISEEIEKELYSAFPELKHS